jgi:hypothetical protein
VPPLGLIVFGEDHFLIRGPQPDPATARELVRRWIFPGLDDLLGKTALLPDWRITTREFREDISWAIQMERQQPASPAVQQLLNEIAGRGVEIVQLPGLPL